ncbi:MAG TPA: DNA repair protein RecO C-terminal domain-containing protein, partial [Bacteroidales bacterium]|nr:DNA repair protein RecO C-terminal domain-containing protein [Bacteroidales bacterium]
TVALFISEILYNVIREEDANRMLFDFIESSVITLDSITAGLSNFHLWFLVAFTAYAGIGPSHTTLKECYFDMLTGQFTAQQPMHPDFFERRDAAMLNRLLKIPAEEIDTLQLSGEERTELLAGLLKYYNLHLTGIRQIRSLQVLKEIFR